MLCSWSKSPFSVNLNINSGCFYSNVAVKVCNKLVLLSIRISLLKNKMFLPWKLKPCILSYLLPDCLYSWKTFLNLFSKKFITMYKNFVINSITPLLKFCELVKSVSFKLEVYFVIASTPKN